MKKNEPFKDEFENKALGPRSFVWAFLICFLMSQNGISIAARDNNKTTVKQNQPAEIEKEVQDDNSSDGEDDNEQNTSVADQDDNSEDDTENKDIVEEGNTKEQLNEIVSEESDLKKSEDIPSDESVSPAKNKPGPDLNNLNAKIAEKQEPKKEPEGLVEVYTGPANVEVLTRHEYVSYKERRKRHGFTIGISSENIYMHEYTSLYDGKLYEELWGQEDVSLPQLNLNYKFNFMLGSISLGAGYGRGSILDDRTGDERTITMEKTSGSFQILFDNFMKEPYFVPYFGVSLFDFKVSEYVKSVDQTHSFTTDMGNAYTVGFLIQLNWLEKESSREAYIENGLENTYLDVYWTQYENPNQAPDPNTQSDFNWGAGLRIEF